MSTAVKDNPERTTAARRLFWCAALTTAMAVVICARIEYLNEVTGSVLPRRDSGTDGNPKWRVAAQRSVRLHVLLRIKNDRLNLFARDNPGTPLPRDDEIMRQPLTEEEQSELQWALERNRRLGALYDYVRTCGLLQYIVAPLAFIFSCIAAIRPELSTRCVLSAIFAILALGCIVMMLHRGYASSLGLYA